jgi:predicted nucleotidyltransferase
LIYEETHPLDIVPFGEIGSSDNHIQWPPEYAIRMSIEGFEECYQNAVRVRLREVPPVDIKVVSLPGLAILKVFSWKDRGIENDKDAKDLGIILHNYAIAGNEDRLFNEESEIMELEDFDIDLAGARLLGRDMAQICGSATKASLVELLEPELDNEGDYRLVRGMTSSPIRDGFKSNTILLTKLLLGLKD